MVTDASRDDIVRKVDLVQALVELGVPRSGLLMVHSSLSSIGNVEGGADTVVDAFLEVLGPEGTLVVPTFTIPAANDPEFLFDPASTPSNSGAISEAARLRSGAFRSIHSRHSVAVIGPLASEIIDPSTISAWGSDSPIAQVMDQGGMFLMLGVRFEYLTAVHVCEIELDVPFRQTRIARRLLRQPDGKIVSFSSQVYPPSGEDPKFDFNRVGRMMEVAGKVKIGSVGNAIARFFVGHEVRAMARAAYELDPNIFVVNNGKPQQLPDGFTVKTSKGYVCVVDPGRIYDGS